MEAGSAAAGGMREATQEPFLAKLAIAKYSPRSNTAEARTRARRIEPAKRVSRRARYAETCTPKFAQKPMTVGPGNLSNGSPEPLLAHLRIISILKAVQDPVQITIMLA